MEPSDKILSTLGAAEELVRDLQIQIEAGQGCSQAIIDLTRVRALLDRAGMLVLDRYLDRCLNDPTQADAPQLLRALELFFRMMPAGAGVPAAPADASSVSPSIDGL